MSEATVLRAALADLLEQCRAEGAAFLEKNGSPDAEGVEEYLEHLKSAEASFRRLAETADTEGRAAVAREILASVARFRNCLEKHKE